MYSQVNHLQLQDSCQLFQLHIVFGILMAFASNAILDGIRNDWRWMLGVEAIPAFIYTLLRFVIPERPRCLIATKGDRDMGMRVLAMISEYSSPDDLT